MIYPGWKNYFIYFLDVARNAVVLPEDPSDPYFAYHATSKNSGHSYIYFDRSFYNGQGQSEHHLVGSRAAERYANGPPLLISFTDTRSLLPLTTAIASKNWTVADGLVIAYTQQGEERLVYHTWHKTDFGRTF